MPEPHEAVRPAPRSNVRTKISAGSSGSSTDRLAPAGNTSGRVEEPGLRDLRACVVEVDPVPAERPGPVAQAPDEGPQTSVGGEVARRHRGHEDVVLRAVRVQDLGHVKEPIPPACALRQALKASCHPEAVNSAGPAGPNAG